MQARNMTNAVFLLLAVHYVFNIEYHPKVKDVLRFIQEQMLGLNTLLERALSICRSQQLYPACLDLTTLTDYEVHN